ncbi:MAG: nucleotidyltransferase domain-containing protein [Bryobacterales bacterium]|nr:nucleotidyltransferase domain-containing protein [Bryobacterales bacterium]MDE0622959.1 nucleotidyltransferase domain-containing protein [Bryobacterales bacterium]
MDAGIAIGNETPMWSLANLARIAPEPLHAVAVKRAVAFGSHARGAAGTQSDLDLVVVIETDIPRLERGRLLGDLCHALLVSPDVLVLIPAEVAHGSRAGLNVFAAIAAERITVFPLGRNVN